MSDTGPRPDVPTGAPAIDDDLREVLGEFLQESAENLDRVDGELVALEERPGDVELLSSVFRTMHTIKGTCGFFGFASLERVTHSAENLLVGLRDGELELDRRTADALLAAVDAVRSMLDSIAADGSEGVADRSALVERLDSIASARTLGAAPPARGAGLPDPTRPSARDRINAPDATIRVDVRTLDALMDLVGELVLSRNRIVACATGRERDPAHAAAQSLDLITTELQGTAMRTRMQAIDTLWTRLPRVARDLARGRGKRVRVEMEGRDTELDRGLLEAIKDPLTHLVRNCIDHGIETPEARAAAGKAREGRLTLRAWHEGGQVHIEIGDDGAGIDPDGLVARAIRDGVLDAAGAAALSDAERVRLIFLAGLSTADTVTSLSGRGVGMDVVRANIERIDGSIDVESVRGRGTLFRLRVPLTLAIVQALVIESDGERFALPQASLAELLSIGGAARVSRLHGASVLHLRGDLLPLVCLSTLLGGGRTGAGPSPEGPRHVAVLESRGARFGLRVDRVRDVQEIVVKALPEVLRAPGVYAGVTVTGDGRPTLVLDAPGIAARAALGTGPRGDGRVGPSGGAGATPPGTDRTVVLLVRDRAGAHAAVPIGDVDRLERIDESRVERVGDRELVRHRGALLPLLRLDAAHRHGARRRFRARAGRAGHGPTRGVRRIVVLAGHGLRLGLCVEAILDVGSVPSPVGAGALAVDGLVARPIDAAALLARHGGDATGVAADVAGPPA